MENSSMLNQLNRLMMEHILTIKITYWWIFFLTIIQKMCFKDIMSRDSSCTKAFVLFIGIMD